jgi:hypothetical protein
MLRHNQPISRGVLLGCALIVIACGDTMSGQIPSEPDTVQIGASAPPVAEAMPGVTPSESTDAAAPESDIDAQPERQTASKPEPHVDVAMPPSAPAVAPPAAQAPPPSAQPEWPEECEQRVVLRAHGASRAADASSYRLDAGAEHIAQFYFKLPWDTEAQLLKYVFAWDNTKVVHHWALYSLRTRLEDGQVFAGEDPLDALRIGDKQFIVGAGRGSSDLELPPDVGLRLPHGPDEGLLLEVHYFNGDDAPAEDRSGLELCVSSKHRPIEAAVQSIGRSEFDLPPHQQTDIQGECAPDEPHEPVHILAITPHMHARGKHAKLVLERRSGERLTLVDQPYDAAEQRTYRISGADAQADVVVQTGDTLTATCTYENASDTTISAGTTVADEMCQMLTVAWPAGVLHKSVDPTRVFGTPQDTDCLE